MRPNYLLLLTFAVHYLTVGDVSAAAVDSEDQPSGPPITQEEKTASAKIRDETPAEVKKAKEIEEADDEINESDDRYVTLDLNNEEDRNVIRDAAKKWPNNEVPYKISSYFGSDERLHIAKAIEELERLTCIRFRDASYRDKGYVKFIRGNRGCWSKLGYAKMERIISIQAPGCMYTTTILHEIMHTLGFYHEQARSDRDKYVKILTYNIKDGKASQFKMESAKTANNYGTAYDFCSIMHYTKDEFGKKGYDGKKKTTIEVRAHYKSRPCAKNPGVTPHLSDDDIKKINELYQCRYHATVNNGRDVKNKECRDNTHDAAYCKRGATWGECEGTGSKNLDFRVKCAKTCNLCNGRTVSDVCLNAASDRDCQETKDQGGCKPGSRNYKYTQQQCRKTCQFCSGSTGTGGGSGGSGGSGGRGGSGGSVGTCKDKWSTCTSSDCYSFKKYCAKTCRQCY